MERLTTRNSAGVAVLKTPYQCERCGEEIYRLADYGSGEPIEKLAGLEDLQEQGRLLELEDKYEKIMIGQEIFTVHWDRKIIVSRKLCLIKEWWNDYQGFQGVYGATPGGVFSSWEFRYEDLGKTVFLTKEEAEEALKRMEDGK